MKILGICHDVFICSACVIADGQIVCAIPEERLDRVKQSRHFPVAAINKCLEQAGLSMAQIDEVAIAWNPAIELETIPDGYLSARRWRVEHMTQVPGQFMQIAAARAASKFTVSNLWADCPPITYLDHYLSHVGNAFFLSPYDLAAILILDGRGEKQTGLLAVGHGTEIDILDEVDFPHSIGLFYSAVTQFLGFRPDRDEWKVMALSCYADWDNPYYTEFSKLIEVDERGRFRLDLHFFEFYNFWDRRMYSDKLVEILGPPRSRNEEISERHQQIAAALQKVFEEKVAEILEHLHRRTGLETVVLSGGCFMNSAFNGKISKLTPFKNSFISSCPDDSGTSVGAAAFLYAQRTGERVHQTSLHNYWGIEFTDHECELTVSRYKLPKAEIMSDPAEAASMDLIQGKLVGWFQGRGEFGQRALGNRSILADPRRAEMKDMINASVKFRESFRPFAPAILAEEVSDYFECEPGCKVPFMERVLRFRSNKTELVPAVVHCDRTGRVQTVEKQTSPRFYALLRHFKEGTGIPIVLNTSFNLNGQPIVNSPDDAIRTFYSCGLDVLYLGNVRVSK